MIPIYIAHPHLPDPTFGWAANFIPRVGDYVQIEAASETRVVISVTHVVRDQQLNSVILTLGIGPR